MDKMIMEY